MVINQLDKKKADFAHFMQSNEKMKKEIVSLDAQTYRYVLFNYFFITYLRNCRMNDNNVIIMWCNI